jgi:hypothetical protein
LEIQQDERDQFERDCTSEEFLMKFSKPSTELLQLRRIQKGLAFAHEFEEAKLVKAQGDRIQHDETLAAQARATEHIRLAYAQLLERQKQQLFCTAENGERKVRAFEERVAREDDAYANLARQLRSRLQETKSKKGSALPPLLPSGSKTVASEPTKQQMKRFKKTGNVSKLEVKLINVKGILGNRTPANVKPVKIV